MAASKVPLMRTPLTCAAALLAIGTSAFAEPDRARGGAAPRELALHVLVQPRLRPTSRGTELTYELVLDNRTGTSIEPELVDVLDADTRTPLIRYGGRTLDEHLDRTGVQSETIGRSPIGPGRRAILYVDLVLREAPQRLTHRVVYREASRSGPPTRIEGGSTSVSTRSAPVIRAPLSGGPWVVIYDSSWTRGHRRVGFVRGGVFRIPGRFASDWVRLDERGRKSAQSGDDVDGRYSYRQPVFAVDDALVISVRSTAPERRRLSEDAPSREGNEITLALRGGAFAHYGHLRPGSAKVSAGDRVRAGQPIAEVGFSGTASDPQLHFALTDGPVESESEGVPYALDRYTLLGAYGSAADIGSTRWVPLREAIDQRASMPAGLDVVSLPSRAVAAADEG